MRANVKPLVPDEEQAEEAAMEVLIWMSHKLDLMERFLAMSGIDADEVRHLIGRRSFYAGVLGFLLGHEPDLMWFCRDRKVDPEWFRMCFEVFSGESVPWL